MDTDDKRKARGRKRWTEEEDAILYEEAMKQSSTGNVRDWHRIATKLPGRTNKDCRKRWVNKVCGGLKKGLWDPEEDRRLQAAVEKHGLRWPLIASEVGFRSPDQCAKRWQYGLDPRLKHREWTAEEDKLLLALVQERGREWKAIQHNHYPTRSRIDLKNRYTILMRRLGNTPTEQDGESNSSDDSGSDSDECGMPGPSSSTTRASSKSTASRTTKDGSRSPNHRRTNQHPRRHSRLQSTASANSEPLYLSGGGGGGLSQQQPDWLTSTTAASISTSLGASASSVSLTALDVSVASPAGIFHDSLLSAHTDSASSLGVDFLDSVTTSAAGYPHHVSGDASGMLHATAAGSGTWDDPLTDMAFPTPTAASLSAFLPAGSYAANHGTAGDGGKLDSLAGMEMDMDMVFDPELLNMPVDGLVRSSSGGSGTGSAAMLSMEMQTASGSGSGSTAGSGSGPGTGSGVDGSSGDQEGMDGIETDLSKVVIAVEGCDKDTLDYLFNVTRPIKGKVKMEITM